MRSPLSEEERPFGVQLVPSNGEADLVAVSLEPELEHIVRVEPLLELHPPQTAGGPEVGPLGPCLGFDQSNDLRDPRHDRRTRKVAFEEAQIRRHGEGDDGLVALAPGLTELEVAHGRRVAPRVGRGYAAALLLLAAACGGNSPQPDNGEVEPYPTVLAPPSTFGGDFAMEQDVTMTHAEGENTFRAVLQKQGNELVLVGLAPHGGRAFVLTQRGTEVTFENFMPRELPFPAEYILHDIHRAWFKDAPGEGGEMEGERVTEQVADGRVTERRYERLDGQPEGAIVVTYEGPGMAPGAPITEAPPERVVLDNQWFGYRATIETRNWQRL